MGKVIVVITLCVLSFAVFAHEDRMLPIKADGTVGVLPSKYGPVRVKIDRSPDDPRSLTGVRLSSPRFRVKLSPCILRRLSAVTHVDASGSWYHDFNSLPPYVSLTFYAGNFNPAGLNEYYSVTFSLLDGRILSGMRAWDPWWGAWRGQHIAPADKCSHWDIVGLWPNNSFKPTPLRGAA